MKILRIIARLNIGGPARNAVLLTEGFSTRPDFVGTHSNNIEWETVLVCGEVEGNEGDMMYLARGKGIEPVMVAELGRELSFWDDWRAFWKIYKIICQEKPDIVHTHTAKAGALGRAAACLYKVKGLRCKVVHTFHGHVLHGYFGGIKTWFFIRVEKILALFTDKIITVSQTLKKELVEGFGIAPGEKFEVVELGFELEELLGLPVGEAGRCVNIGIVGRLAPIKNHKMLMRIASSIVQRAERMAGNIRFVIIGDGELRHELERYAEELGIKEMVEFVGWVKDLKKIYEELDIVVLTSLNEGTPVSIIEAMAAGRPVVASDVGGVKDIIKDGESGYLVGSGDEKDFSERLMELINDAEKRRRFGQYGRSLVKDRFSKDRLIKDTEGLYNTMCYHEGAFRLCSG